MEAPVFVYRGHEITFQKEDGSVMVNATEMAKVFDKQPVHWINQVSSDNFIRTYAKLKNRSLADLVVIARGGDNPGTWMHEDIALEFARWLSPEFAIWCNDRIKELIQRGYTKLDSISRKDLAKMLLESEEEKERLIQDVAQLGARTLEQEKALEAAAPKVLFADTVTASADSILIGELAKIICQKGIEIGEKRLFAWMRNNGYLCSRPGEYYNRPAQRYIEQGLFEIKKGSVMHSNGTVLVTTTPMVTGKGQLYFVNKFLYQKK